MQSQSLCVIRHPSTSFKMMGNTSIFSHSAGRQRHSLKAVKTPSYGAIFCFKSAKVTVIFDMVSLLLQPWISRICKGRTVCGAHLPMASTAGKFLLSRSTICCLAFLASCLLSERLEARRLTRHCLEPIIYPFRQY